MMLSKRSVLTFISLTLIITLFSCLPDDNEVSNEIYSAAEFKELSSVLNIPVTPFSYEFGLPISDDAIDHKGTLGRVLFYDKNLSEDASVSCASCHRQELAFSDDKDKSLGPNGNFTARNSIALGAVKNFGMHYNEDLDKLAPGLFWDERAGTIKEQLKQTINNPNEMGVSLDHIVDLVSSQEYYQILHDKAFQTSVVSEDHILESLEAFINSIGTSNSKFENDVIENLNFITGDFVTGEIDNQLGFELFMTNCTSCHGKNLSFPIEVDDSNIAVVENTPSVANNGLLLADDDLGVYANTQDISDLGKFKIPGLFNIELTAPYMHDGRFATLEEVVEHYSTGVQYSESLGDPLKDGDQAKSFNWTSEEKTALVDFLKTLTGEGITSNEIWSDPFK